MKKLKVMNIGNEDFTLKNKILNQNDIYWCSYNDIYECYSRPSNEKVNIYNYWRDLIYNNCEVVNYGIRGYNCNMFSLNAIVRIEEEYYYIYITKTKNEIYKINW